MTAAGDHPAWRAGHDARREGKPRDANPYALVDPRESQWDDGWLYADGEAARANVPTEKYVRPEKPRR